MHFIARVITVYAWCSQFFCFKVFLYLHNSRFMNGGGCMTNDSAVNSAQADRPARKTIPNNPKHPRHHFAMSCVHEIIEDPVTKGSLISYDQSTLPNKSKKES